MMIAGRESIDINLYARLNRVLGFLSVLTGDQLVCALWAFSCPPWPCRPPLCSRHYGRDDRLVNQSTRPRIHRCTADTPLFTELALPFCSASTVRRNLITLSIGLSHANCLITPWVSSSHACRDGRCFLVERLSKVSADFLCLPRCRFCRCSWR